MALKGIDTTEFDTFTTFAIEWLAGLSARSVVRRVGDSAVRAIKANNPQLGGVKKDRHDADERAANDAVREKFKQAVANLFGSEERIPEDVKKAMHLEDYGLGKPLTARRIDTVRQAVERHFADYPAAFAEAKANAGSSISSFEAEAVDAAIAAGISPVTQDADATKLVARHIGHFIIRDDAKLCELDEVREKAHALLGSVVELRTAAKGDHKAFEAGLRFLDRIGGKALPPGSFTSIIAATKTLNDADAILAKSGADAVLSAPSEKTSCREFIGELLSKNPKSRQRKPLP